MPAALVAPQVVDPAVPIWSGVTDWSQSIQRGGAWYATAVQIGSVWTILRSPDGINWTSIGLPAGFPTSYWHPFAISSAGVVTVARAGTTVGVNAPIHIAQFGSAWVARPDGSCYYTAYGNETVFTVLASGSYLAIVTTGKRCLVTSTNGGTSWISGTTLSAGAQYFLTGHVLHAITCTASDLTASGYGRFSLITNSGVWQPQAPLVGCDSPTLVEVGTGGKVAWVSTRKISGFLSLGRSYLISLSSDYGGTWTVLSAGEPLPYRMSNGSDTSIYGSHSDKLFFGGGDGVVQIRSLAAIGSNSVVTGLSRQVLPSNLADPDLWQNPVDPGQWQSDPWRYTVAATAAKRVLVPPRTAAEVGPVDGMVFSGSTLYALKGQSALLPSVPALSRPRTGVEVEHVSYAGVSAVATSHSGAWSAYQSAPTSGVTPRVYRVRPDGTVEDLGPALGTRLLISDLGQVMTIGNRNINWTSTCECERAAVAYWYTDEWFGPAAVGRSTFGVVTSTEEFQAGLPQVHMTSTWSGKEYISADYGVTWAEQSQSAGTISGSSPEIAAFSAPYKYYVLGQTSSGYIFARRTIGTGAVYSAYLPSGMTPVKILIGPNDPAKAYVVVTAASGAVSLLRIRWNLTTETVLSGLTPPSTGLEYSFGQDGRLYARKTSVCSTAAFVNEWSVALTGTAFTQPKTLWWGPVPAAAAGGAGKVLVPARPNGAIDEWQIFVASVSNTLVGPANLAATQSGFGTGGYGAIGADVNMSLGNFTQEATDLSVPTAGRALELNRTYNGLNQRVGLFGQGWSTTYEMRTVLNCGTGAITVVYPDGRTETHTPNGAGGFTAPAGVTTKLEVVGSLHHLTLVDGTKFEFSSSNGRMQRIIDVLGRVQQLTWGPAGPTKVTDVLTGRSLTLVYTGSFVTEVRTSAVTVAGQSAPLITRYGYVGNLLERACAATDPDLSDGDCTLYTMTGGRMSAVVDANGNTDVAVGYDGAGRPAWKENGVGGRTLYDYQTPLRTVVTDPTGVTSVVESDRELRQVRVTDHLGQVTEYGYDINGFPSRTELPSGVTTTASYDVRGNLLAQTDGAGASSYVSYDVFGNPVSSSDGRATDATDIRYATTMTWDGPRHLLLTSTQPPTAGVPTSTTTRTYTTGTEPGVDGGVMPGYLLRTETSPTGETTTFSYDRWGNLRTVVAPSGMTTWMTYDELGRIVSVREVSDTYPLGITRLFEYDAAGRVVKEWSPAITNPVTGETHQQLVEHSFDEAGNLTMVTRSDVGGSTNPDPTRQLLYSYDDADRRIAETVVGFGTRFTEYDAAGRAVTFEDELGNVTVTEYDDVGRPLREYAQADPILGPVDDVSNWLRTYDVDGRVQSTTDALGRVTHFTYDGAGRVLTETVIGFVDPQSVTRNVVTLQRTYDAAGNVLTSTSGNGLRQEQFTYDEAGRLLTSTLDPLGLNRVTSYTYDASDRVVGVSVTDGTRTESVSLAFDSAGRQVSAARNNGSVDLVTTFEYDERGLRVAVTSPRGNVDGADSSDYTTSISYNEVGAVSQISRPAVVTYASGVIPTVVQPTVIRGYNTFGEQTNEVDERGGQTSWVFDQRGQILVIEHPEYTTPIGIVLNPSEVYSYDAAGNVTSYVDRRGFETSYVLDYASRVTSIVGPSSLGGTRVAHQEFDAAGQQTAFVDPSGARVETTFDGLGRAASRVDIVRRPVGPADEFVWLYEYDDLGNVIKTTSPEGRTTEREFNAASEMVSSTDGRNETSTFEYDLAGRLVATTDPLGRQGVTEFDQAGRPVSFTILDPFDAPLSTEHREYDEDGNLTLLERPNGVATAALADDSVVRYSYNALGWLTEVLQPTGALAEIETEYRWDASGNTTAVVNGNGVATYYQYNPWNLQESVVEPATAAHTSLADRTWTSTYDAGGLLVSVSEPGGYEHNLDYNPYGELEQRSASLGATATSTVRAYDLAGRVIGVDSPEGTISFDYDDRGLLTGTSGAARYASSYTYGPDGLPASRTDVNGLTTFEWDERGQFEQLVDANSGSSLDYTHDAAGQLTQAESSSGATYHYSWDNFGRLTEELVAAPPPHVGASRQYTYDLNGNLLTQTVQAPGNPQAGLHTYSYDWADRLIEWDNPNDPPETYAWDNAGNRTSAGTTNFTYDERNRLVSSSSGLTNSFNARGDLVETSTTAGTTANTFDPLGRLVTTAGRTLSYDGLGRIATFGSETYSYAGTGMDPVALGAWTFGRDADGLLVSASSGTLSALAVPDRHGDASLLVDSSTGVVTGTRVFAPFGEVAGSAGIAAPVGFQGDVTDALTGDVWMGARWMSPAMGVFTSRDSYAGKLTTPASLNRYSYANGNPTTMWDPSGHSAEPSGSGFGWAQVKDAFDQAKAAEQQAAEERKLARERGDVRYAAGLPLLNPTMSLIVASKSPPIGFVNNAQEFGRGVANGVKGWVERGKAIYGDLKSCYAAAKTRSMAEIKAGCQFKSAREVLSNLWYGIRHPEEVAQQCFDNPSYCLGEAVGGALLTAGLGTLISVPIKLANHIPSAPNRMSKPARLDAATPATNAPPNAASVIDHHTSVTATRAPGGGGVATEAVPRPTSYPISEAGAPLAGGRTTGINRAWTQERDLLNAGGGTRDWTADEARQLWMNGSVDGYTGHHINSVEAFPEWRGDPRNIRFLTNGMGTNEHLYSPLGHGGAWQNPTSGNLIDRAAMIEQLVGGGRP